MPETDTLILKPDPQNANRGTPRGAALLRESLDACGVGRSIVTDRHGTIIGGNKTYAQAALLGLDTEIVETDGHDLVVVQREDLDLAADPKARQLAYYDNRTQQVDLSWNTDQVRADVLAGVDVGVAFFPEELDALAPHLPPPPEPLPPTVGGLAPDVPVEPVAMAPMPIVPPVSEARQSFTLSFNTVEQQLRWGWFMRALRAKYPDLDTPGARLTAFLTEQGLV